MGRTWKGKDVFQEARELSLSRIDRQAKRSLATNTKHPLSSIKPQRYIAQNLYLITQVRGGIDLQIGKEESVTQCYSITFIKLHLCPLAILTLIYSFNYVLLQFLP